MLLILSSKHCYPTRRSHVLCMSIPTNEPEVESFLNKQAISKCYDGQSSECRSAAALQPHVSAMLRRHTGWIEFESVLVRFTTTPTDFQDRIPVRTFILLDPLRFDTSMFCPDLPISPNDGSTSWTDSCFGRSEA